MCILQFFCEKKVKVSKERISTGVPEAFKGRGGESREWGIQGGGSESPQSRERGILPCSAIFFLLLLI